MITTEDWFECCLDVKLLMTFNDTEWLLIAKRLFSLSSSATSNAVLIKLGQKHILHQSDCLCGPAVHMQCAFLC